MVLECEYHVFSSCPGSKAVRIWHICSSHIMSTQATFLSNLHRRLAEVTQPGRRGVRMRIQVPLQYNSSSASSGGGIPWYQPGPTPLCLAHLTQIQTPKLKYKKGCMNSLPRFQRTREWWFWHLFQMRLTSGLIASQHLCYTFANISSLLNCRRNLTSLLHQMGDHRPWCKPSIQKT